MFRACPWLVALATLALAALLLGLNAYLLLLTLSVVAAALLAFSYNEAACVIWLIVTGCTLEMWLGDLLGPDAYQPIIAVVKTAGLLLALLAGLRFGSRLDPFNPVFAYAFMFASGLVHGLHPGLTVADSIRSVAGSAAPFAFSFSRLSRRWTDQIIRITAWTPLIDVALGAVFGALGIRPLFIDSGGARLAALSHPAFLAGFALAGVYASLIELFRTGANRWLVLLLANLAVLLLTGARAPATYGLAVLALTLAFAPSSDFPRSRRLGLVLGLAACLPAILLFAGDLTGLRLFNAVSNYNSPAISADAMSSGPRSKRPLPRHPGSGGDSALETRSFPPPVRSRRRCTPGPHITNTCAWKSKAARSAAPFSSSSSLCGAGATTLPSTPAIASSFGWCSSRSRVMPLRTTC